ncbi:MAG: hypothetical protein CW338_10935 [Clostridiales bacterium]|nr:hypothetical protein [Clostridiales bacterium]
MRTNKKTDTVKAYAVITGTACLMAINYFILILPNQFAPAGLNGLATMAQYLFHFSIGYISLIINIPLALVCFLKFDRRFACRTVVFSLVFSGMLLLFQSRIIDISRFIYHTDDGRSTIIAPVAAGVINGFIYACAIRSGGSTGGTDFVAEFIHKYRPEYSMMKLIFGLNTAVAVISYFVYDFNIEPVLLCVAYCFVTSSVSDRLIKGGKEALKVELITAHAEEITQRVIRDFRHSVTIVKAEGGYSRTEKTMLIIVINKHQITRLLDMLAEYSETFACVSSVTETLGNFKHISRNSLLQHRNAGEDR